MQKNYETDGLWMQATSSRCTLILLELREVSDSLLLKHISWCQVVCWCNLYVNMDVICNHWQQFECLVNWWQQVQMKTQLKLETEHRDNFRRLWLTIVYFVISAKCCNNSCNMSHPEVYCFFVFRRWMNYANYCLTKRNEMHIGFMNCFIFQTQSLTWEKCCKLHVELK